MTENKKELKDTHLNDLVLHMEDLLTENNIDVKLKCNIMLGVTAIVTECFRNPPSFDESFDIHDYCKTYAIRYCELLDNPVIKLLNKMFLE